jgi:hypothetical protein
MSCDIEVERARLQVELAYVLQRGAFPTAIAIASRAARIADLEEQLRALPPKPPAPLIGMASGGSTTVCDRRLGTDYARPELVDDDDSRHVHEDHPHLREYGDSIT